MRTIRFKITAPTRISKLAFRRLISLRTAQHGAPLERENLDMPQSINISILRIEECDSDWNVSLTEKILQTGITGGYTPIAPLALSNAHRNKRRKNIGDLMTIEKIQS